MQYKHSVKARGSIPPAKARRIRSFASAPESRRYKFTRAVFNYWTLSTVLFAALGLFLTGTY
ncbi:MAG: hypothetical protein LC734_06035, partial [Acidobacteria bacterium]|nr:hypothetical protein [Acidobacteriota bacterium]